MGRADALTPGERQADDPWEPTDPLHERVAEACRFVGAGHDVRGVHIVAGRRPTYGELRDFQMCAGESRVRLTVGGGGMVSVRPLAREDDG